MSYNYAKELKKWKIWKEKEEKILRELNVDEDIIQKLYDYDWNNFKMERRYRTRQMPTLDCFFTHSPTYDHKEIITIHDLLDQIENEALFNYLSQTDRLTLNILLLKILGYSTKEISEILSLQCSAIYARIARLRKKLKNF